MYREATEIEQLKREHPDKIIAVVKRHLISDSAEDLEAGEIILLASSLKEWIDTDTGEERSKWEYMAFNTRGEMLDTIKPDQFKIIHAPFFGIKLGGDENTKGRAGSEFESKIENFFEKIENKLNKLLEK